jgi:shikimate dehydrogenase
MFIKNGGENAIEESETAINENEKAINESETAINESKTAINENEKAIKGSEKAAVGSVAVGYNTDFQGFKYLLESNGIDVRGKEIFILGDGGTTATVKAVLGHLRSGRVTVVSRRGEVDYENYMRFSNNAAVLINASPVGMYPENGKCSVDLENFKKLEAVVDVVYNPLKTRLIFLAEERGIKCCSGLQMLVAQAKFAAELFTGKSVENRVIEGITKAIISEKRNVVLIGMPGAGKSSVGRAVAAASRRDFIDTDEEIIRNEGLSIPSIFEKKGEKYFREREIFAVGEAGKQSGKVVSTGGGVVLNRENYYALRQNSVVIYVKRKLKFLETRGRPLSAKFSAKELFDARDGLYREFADYEIENDGKIADAVKKIIDIMNEGLTSI